MPDGVPSIDLVAGQWDGPRDRWLAAFTPGNTTFSGHLPALVDAPDGLARSYYLAAWQVVRGDAGPRAAALLDPVRTRARLLAALARAAGSFRAIEAYLVLTGDLDLLAEKAGGATVLDHLRALAASPGDTARSPSTPRGSAGPGRSRRCCAGSARPTTRRRSSWPRPSRARDVLARYAGGGRWHAASRSARHPMTGPARSSPSPARCRSSSTSGSAPSSSRSSAGSWATSRPARSRTRCAGWVAPDRAAALLAGAERPGAAELEAILAGLFGIRADFAGWEAGARRVRPRGLGRLELGRLDNLPAALT